MNPRPVFATITTASYLPYVLAQHESLRHFLHETFVQHVLCLDQESLNFLKQYAMSTLDPVGWQDIATDAYLSKREEKAGEINLFCFLSKPFFLRHLLESVREEQVIYLDADILAVGDPQKIFQEDLQQQDICLTPHASLGEFQQYAAINGIINGGFVGVTRRAMDFVRWWEARCFEKCEWDRSLSPSEGGAVDQGYLEKAATLFPRVGLLGREYNSAIWNCEKIEEINGSFFSDGKPVVFFHFASHQLQSWTLKPHKMLMARDPGAALYKRFHQMLSQAMARRSFSSELAGAALQGVSPG